MIFRLALRNALKHKMSSLVFIIVFGISTLLVYWCFGFSNYIVQTLEPLVRASYGDIAFSFKLTEISKLEKFRQQALKRWPEIEKIVFEREIRVMVDGDNKSTVVILTELTADNMGRLIKYLRPKVGRLPKNQGEIAITDYIQSTNYKLGTEIYLTTTTSAGIINTLKYKIVGVLRSTALKAMGFGYLVPQSNMDSLINSNHHYGLLYLYLKDKMRSLATTTRLQNEIKEYLQSPETTSIKVTNSWNALQILSQLSIFLDTFIRVKYLLLIFIFPLLGAIIAAIVWMYSFKRRKEIWTYHCMGLRPQKIILAIGGEYLLITFVGTSIGIIIGEISAMLADYFNVWLTFSYTIITALHSDFSLLDGIIVLTFMQLMVLIWIRWPINRILRVPPFSF